MPLVISDEEFSEAMDIVENGLVYATQELGTMVGSAN